MEIPESLIKLEWNSAILEVGTGLDELGVREGDTFGVRYYSKADCRAINECIVWMKKLLDYLRRSKESGVIGLNSIGDSSCLDTLAFRLFLPWLEPRTYANKAYFISSGGLILVSELMNITLVVPFIDLPEVLSNIESQILMVLWNITEDASIRRAVVQSGGIENCTRALLRVPIESQRLIFRSKEIIRRSIGVFTNLCELHEIRLKIVNNIEIIEQMISVARCHLFEDKVMHCVVMIFLVLSYTQETHSHLLLSTSFKEFMKIERFRTPFPSIHQILARYHKRLLHSILVLHSPQYFSKEDKALVVLKLASFNESAHYKVLSLYECKKSIIWDSVLPHVKALYQPDKPELDNNLISLCKQTVIIALLTMLVTENHRRVLVREQLVDYIICLPWHTSGRVQERAMELVAMVREVPDVPYRPPSLLNLAKGAASMYFCGLDKVMRLSVPELARELWDTHYSETL